LGRSLLLRRLPDGLLAIWALLALELLAVGIGKRSEWASVWELELGAFWLLPTAAAVSVLAALSSAALFALLERGESHAARSSLTLIVTFSAGGLGWALGGGRHLAEGATRSGFAVLVGLCAGAVVLFLAPLLARALRRSPGRSALGVALSVALLELANHFVLPRLYPALHWGLAGLSLLIAPWVLLRAASAASAPRHWFPGVLLVASAVAVLFVAPSARRLAHFDNFRFLLLEQAPILGKTVELAAKVAPPTPWDSTACGEGMVGVGCAEAATQASPGAGSLDLRGRDFLLVSIDALRADHLGSYGYSRPTTPNIDRLAEGAALFERAYTATPHTSYAVTSLMTGKYMRPLLLQGAGGDSDTWASLLRTYGYRTAAFFPPAVFFIDTERFASFRKSALGFEYSKVEFAEGEPRVEQVRRYLKEAPGALPLFVWVHLFGPHEPYVAHAEHPFGDRDIDRYDSEIAAADATLGELVSEFRARRPRGVVIVTADHGEEFGDHGGRYHGTTVYEEQLRVPLVISAPGAIAPRRVREVVQSIDLLPTVLGGLRIPRPPRVRGRDLGELLAQKRAEEAGFAHGETDEQTLLARGELRLVCARRIGACKLYDLAQDPLQENDVLGTRRLEADKLRAELKEVTASHGRFESQGLRAEGKGWPAPILRGLSGDADSAQEVAALLDDVDPAIRSKAAEVLFELRRPESAPALRLALGRDDNAAVRTYAALGLTRLGEGAPLVIELLGSPDQRLRRLAALALGESGDRRGSAILIDWWRDAEHRDFQRSRELLAAFGTLRLRDAVWFLCGSLSDVRLRPYLARALAKIGEESARVPLARAFADERSQSARAELGQALVELGAREEIAPALVRFLGVPDPLANGLEIAMKAKVLPLVGGPGEKELPRLRSRSELGTRVRVVVPKKGGNGRGVRILVRASCPKGGEPGALVLGSAAHLVRFDRAGKSLPERGVPQLDESRSLKLPLRCESRPLEVFATLPANLAVRPGSSAEFILFASRNVSVEAFALVPLADELPPPPPKPWSPEAPGE
jgi:arylsulfatase A-like enzyme